MSAPAPLWEPTDRDLELTRFQQEVAKQSGAPLRSYRDFHRWSIENPETFWREVWQRYLIGEPGAPIAIDRHLMPGAKWFPNGRLNFTENLLRRTGPDVAAIYRDETGAREQISWDSLRNQVDGLAGELHRRGLQAGDRVAAIVPNRIETLICVLACARLGVIWSSCSPDFGTTAILDRFGQIEPRLLISCQSYSYNGRQFEVAEKCHQVVEQLPCVELHLQLEALPEWIGDAHAAPPVEHFPADHPLYILFSSGTTGQPKCIVHTVAGALLKHATEHRLHADIRADDRVLFFTTCGWMMWNWLIGALAADACICLYDGAPTHPQSGVLFEYAASERVTHLGISPGLVGQLGKTHFHPSEHYDLSHLRVLLSTGSPLSEAGFRWMAEHIAAVQIASITGGTDILGCFAGGIPSEPVYAGDIQGPNLGMALDFFDIDGSPATGSGELVCTQSFPSMPAGFWNDSNGERYRNAYFGRWENIWHHGDFGEYTATGGVIIHGRSDAVLNRGGVRIGTAELYRQAEQVEAVLEALAVAQEWNNDVRIVLFVRLAEGSDREAVAMEIRQKIRSQASPRHVPDLIVPVADLPRTRSGKLSELAVRDVIHGRAVQNTGALANPESLELFRGVLD